MASSRSGSGTERTEKPSRTGAESAAALRGAMISPATDYGGSITPDRSSTPKTRYLSKIGGKQLPSCSAHSRQSRQWRQWFLLYLQPEYQNTFPEWQSVRA